MVIKITEEQFIQEMLKKHPKSFTTEALRTIWDYVNKWDEGELFIPAEINKKFLQVQLFNDFNNEEKYYSLKEIIENSEDFLKINDNEYIEVL